MKDRGTRDRERRGAGRSSATALAAFCATTVLFLVYRDLFVPHVRDTEVWFGLEVHGPLAWATAPIHWSIFALGAWGFHARLPKIWRWASIYAYYVAASHVVWNITSPSGEGWLAGLVQGALFAIPGVLLGLGPFDQERRA